MMTYKKLLLMRYQDMADGLRMQKDQTLGKLAKAGLRTLNCMEVFAAEADLEPIMTEVMEKLWCLNLMKRTSYPPLWILLGPLCEKEMPFLLALDEEDLGFLTRCILAGLTGVADRLPVIDTQQRRVLQEQARRFVAALNESIPEEYADAMLSAREAAGIVVSRDDRNPADAEYYAMHIVARLLVPLSAEECEGEEGIELGVWLAQNGGATEAEIAAYERQLYGQPDEMSEIQAAREEDSVIPNPDSAAKSEDDEDAFIPYLTHTAME